MSESKPHKKVNVSELEARIENIDDEYGGLHDRIEELEQKLEDALETETENDFTETSGSHDHVMLNNSKVDIKVNVPQLEKVLRELSDLRNKMGKQECLFQTFMNFVHPDIGQKLSEYKQFQSALYSPDIPFSDNVRDVLEAKKNALEKEIRDMARHLQKKQKKQTSNLFEEKGAEL
jgi:chromosome segregation ATPase